jgi:purine-binding chemotaxis protein CheW
MQNSTDKQNKWQKVYQDLEMTQATINKVKADDLEHKEKILRERSKRIGLLIEEEKSQQEGFDCVQFCLANQQYIVDLSFVGEVQVLKNITALPCVPAFILGITNLRGKIITVLDIRSLLDLPNIQTEVLQKLLIIQRNDIHFGIAVEEVSNVKNISHHSLQSELPTSLGNGQKFIQAITKEGLILLDIAKICEDESIVINDVA